MKKFSVFLLMLLLVVSVTGCSESAVLDETYFYEAESDIHTLHIQIGAADFSVVPADAVSVESNLKYLSISEKNGVLKIVDKKTVGVTYENPVLTLYLPPNIVFDEIDIFTGAAALRADSLSAKVLKLRLGAGDINISHLTAEEKAEISGGAGEISVNGGSIRNLELEMGLGELNLITSLSGNNELTLGMGESNIQLIGKREDYRIRVEKGVGSITVDGESVSSVDTNKDGQHYVEIKGGVGSINLSFREP